MGTSLKFEQFINTRKTPRMDADAASSLQNFTATRAELSAMKPLNDDEWWFYFMAIAERIKNVTRLRTGSRELAKYLWLFTTVRIARFTDNLDRAFDIAFADGPDSLPKKIYDGLYCTGPLQQVKLTTYPA